MFLKIKKLHNPIITHQLIELDFFTIILYMNIFNKMIK